MPSCRDLIVISRLALACSWAALCLRLVPELNSQLNSFHALLYELASRGIRAQLIRFVIPYEQRFLPTPAQQSLPRNPVDLCGKLLRRKRVSQPTTGGKLRFAR